MSTSGGTKSLTYNINPKGTSVSKVKAAKKDFKVTWKKQRTQTTGYQVQYSTSSKFKKAKTVTISKKRRLQRIVRVFIPPTTPLAGIIAKCLIDKMRDNAI